MNRRLTTKEKSGLPTTSPSSEPQRPRRLKPRRRKASPRPLTVPVMLFLCVTSTLIGFFIVCQKATPPPALTVLNDIAPSNSLSLPSYPKRDTTLQNQLSPQALQMCTQALWHTLESTTIVLPNQETFIHTGDIDDLWLRDSAAQVHTLLTGHPSLLSQDPQLDRIVSGLIRRSAQYIRHDPYANAFRIDDSYVFSEAQKRLGRHDLISTWNYELDSACYFMRMLWYYWNESKDPKVLTEYKPVQEAVEIMVDLWVAEQKHEDDAFPTGPLFDCVNCNKPYRYPELPREGKGTPTNPNAGLTWTGFRPSDDKCKYAYLVPANMFAVVALGYAVDLSNQLWNNPSLATKAQKLADEIEAGIQKYAIVDHAKYGKIYAYEVDGLGNYFLMDDANVPSLMSLPYLGYKYDPQIYANTRKFILSLDNPTFVMSDKTPGVTGRLASYGSPHARKIVPHNIWPMAMAIQGLTSDSTEEKIRIIHQLVEVSAGTLWMHESFSKDNPKHYTRSWFCWADALYAELVRSVTTACPDPSHKYRVLEWRDPTYVEGLLAEN